MENKIINWRDISYLREGNNVQQRSYNILKKINIFEILKDYNPILVGTIPIKIDVENSDLDIVCKVEDFSKFKEILDYNFGENKDFRIKENTKESIIVCNFKVDNMEIEIYATKEESHKTNGYRHMVVEARLLDALGNDFKDKIINLKSNGLKTEPAFAKVLNLEGNPYESLLVLEEYSHEELKNLIF